MKTVEVHLSKEVSLEIKLDNYWKKKKVGKLFEIKFSMGSTFTKKYVSMNVGLLNYVLGIELRKYEYDRKSYIKIIEREEIKNEITFKELFNNR